MGRWQWALGVCAVLAGPAFAQSKPRIVSVKGRLELPITLQLKLVAGQTPAGTPVRAKLEMATLVDGVVIPRGATLSGHVEESIAKTDKSSSRLKLKIDSAEWKKGSAPLHAYFSGCFYPLGRTPQRESPSDDSGIHGAASAGIGGMEPINTSPHFPGTSGNSAPEQDPRRFPSLAPDAPAAEVSSKWEHILGLDRVQDADGSIAVTSTIRTIKLDKNTTYMFEQVEATPGTGTTGH